MNKSRSLTAAQLRVLTVAARRRDRLVLPLPPEQRAHGGARSKLLATLLEREFVQEVPVDDADIAWRTADEDCHLALCLTGAGLAAAGSLEVASVTFSEPVASPLAVAPTAATDNPTVANLLDVKHEPSLPAGKLGQVLQAISAAPGATLSEITTLTSWLPHTARAAVTGLRQRGFPIRMVEQDGRKAYRRVEAG